MSLLMTQISPKILLNTIVSLLLRKIIKIFKQTVKIYKNKLKIKRNQIRGRKLLLPVY